MSFLNSKSRGVTLIELSIVLAILGVLIIATISGRSLIDISRATATMQQLRDRSLAFQIFSSTYDCIPGDCYDATAKIGSLAADVNGNGNGNIEVYGLTNTHEVAFAEYHLVAAKLFNRTIAQGIPLVTTASADNDLAQILTPSKVSGALISSIGYGNAHYNLVGAVSQANSTTPDAINNTAVNPSVFQIIDTKIDEAVPSTGGVVCASSVQDSATIPGTTIATLATDYSTNCILLAKMDF